MLADKYERAQRLALAIRRRGFKTLKDAAIRHGYKRTTLTAHCNGGREFDIDLGYEYAKTFKADPIWLFGLTDEENGKVLGDTYVPSPQVLQELLAIAMNVATDDHEKLAELQDVSHAVHTGLRMLAADPSSEADPGYLRAVRLQVEHAVDAARSQSSTSP